MLFQPVRFVRPILANCRSTTRALSTQYIDLEVVESNVLVLSLNRSEGRNAFSKQMLQEFNDAISVDAIAKVSKDIRAMILKSNVDKVFSAGADLKERLMMPEEEVSILSYLNTFDYRGLMACLFVKGFWLCFITAKYVSETSSVANSNNCCY